jgi:hypothetical protein
MLAQPQAHPGDGRDLSVEDLDPGRPPPAWPPEQAGELLCTLAFSVPLTGKPFALPAASPSQYPFPLELTLASNCSTRRQSPVQKPRERKPRLWRLSFWPGPSLSWILSLCCTQMTYTEVRFQVTSCVALQVSGVHVEIPTQWLQSLPKYRDAHNHHFRVAKMEAPKHTANPRGIPGPHSCPALY